MSKEPQTSVSDQVGERMASRVNNHPQRINQNNINVEFSSVQFATINVVLSAKHFRTTTQ